MLFRNLGGGRFADVTRQRLRAEDLGGDKHGAAWADFDNDGRPGPGAVDRRRAAAWAPKRKRLFRNTGDRFEDVAEPMGVFNPDARTRMPLWLDLDSDGKLDLFQGAEARFDDKTPPFVFRQAGAGFEPDTAHG